MKQNEAYKIGTEIGKLNAEIKNLSIHFTNHLSHHRYHNWFTLIQTLVIIGLFCVLKFAVK